MITVNRYSALVQALAFACVVWCGVVRVQGGDRLDISGLMPNTIDLEGSMPKCQPVGVRMAPNVESFGVERGRSMRRTLAL